MIETKPLYGITYALTAFIDECKKLGYKNNDSLERMNFYKTLNEGGKWFATFVDDKIVGVSGVHEFRGGVRALYRGAQLYSRPGGLSKNHMNCWMFYYHLPLVIESTTEPIYITTNTENDASGSMLRLNKLYYILEKRGIVDHISEEELFGVEQNVWRLNKETYLNARGK
jgi:hypothetical protein|tara:strand:+ start:975 stop:1484 length:510 start_codon:yes stop_codon:yes gene_type:complete